MKTGSENTEALYIKLISYFSYTSARGVETGL